MYRQPLWRGSVVAFACALTVGLAAQTSRTPSTQTTSQTDKQITVTGCVQRASDSGSSGTGGTSGTSGSTSASSSKFILTNAMMGSGGTSGSTSGTTGSSTSSGSSGSMKTYRLDTTDDSKLTPHVGHKVEVSGTLEEQSSTTSSSSTSGTSGTTGTSSTSSANAPKLKVDSVRMLSSTCS